MQLQSRATRARSRSWPRFRPPAAPTGSARDHGRPLGLEQLQHALAAGTSSTARPRRPARCAHHPGARVRRRRRRPDPGADGARLDPRRTRDRGPALARVRPLFRLHREHAHRDGARARDRLAVRHLPLPRGADAGARGARVDPHRRRDRKPGSALFSGSTFVVALLGMFLVPTSIMRSLAAGAIIVGIVSVAAALTLLPALIALFGDRIDSLRVPILGRNLGRADRLREPLLAPARRQCPAAAPAESGTGSRRHACGHPGSFSLHIGESGVTTLPADMPSRAGYVVLQQQFPATGSRSSPRAAGRWAPSRTSGARSRPTRASARHAPHRPRRHQRPQRADPWGRGRLRGRQRRARPARAPDSGRVRQLPGPRVRQRRDGRDGRLLRRGHEPDALRARIRARPEPDRADDRIPVDRRRSRVDRAQPALRRRRLRTARSCPCAASASGFQRVHTIDAWVPLFCFFSVLFALSMDYQVFLMSRIKERYDESGSTRDAVATGISSTARIITGAALIIIIVFAGLPPASS